MLKEHIRDIVVCPVCRQALAWTDAAATCASCGARYPILDGIPSLYPSDAPLTIDPGQLRLKDKAAAVRTIADMAALDSGFIRSPRLFYLIGLVLIVSAVIRFGAGVAGLVLILLADWAVFIARRRRVLAGYAANPLRLRTAADEQAVDALYRREGKSQPTMAQWVAAAGEVSASRGERGMPPEAGDERYRDIARVYRDLSRPAGVVLDVGVNEGLTYTGFGIGRGEEFIGLDISRLLLQKFREQAPEQTALLGHGAWLPLKDSSVGFLICTETLEHLESPERAVAEFVRVLAPGGRLIIQSPNAHRIRNLNPFHLLTLVAGLLDDRLLLVKEVHENTWHNATTYHWDFSVARYRRMVRDAGGAVRSLYSREFFCPGFLLRGRIGRYRAKERFLAALPVVRYLGGDLVVVVEKGPVA